MPGLDALPYCDLPIPETSITRLHATAQAWGVDAAPPDDARVLELGCAHGVNLLSMASRHPGTSFVGVDLDADAIGIARRRAARCGLHNATFVQADLASYTAQPETCDYVVAHGVYSWVDARRRGALMSLMGQALAEHGVGYVSYNALPGASVRLAVGAVLRGAVEGSRDASEATSRMRLALQQLRSGPQASPVPHRLLQDELTTLDAQPDAYLHHEFLGAHHTAWGIAEFCDAAQEHGLKYLDDLSSVPLATAALEALCEHCEGAARSRVHAQSLLDAAVFRSFRATLLVRAEQTLASEKRHLPPHLVPTTVPARPRVSAWTRLEAEELGFVTTRIHRARTLHPLHAALVAACDGSRDVDALVAVIRAKIEVGAVVLQNAAGDVADPKEVAAGLPMVVQDALEQLASGGLFLTAARSTA